MPAPRQSLRRDNGWLTLAGRYVMKPGVNTFGTGADNDIVFPKGLGPERMGTIAVAPGRVFVQLAPGLTMAKDGIPMSDKVMDTGDGADDWVSMGRAAFHVIEHNGRYVLRLADNESALRRDFGGRVWYPVDPKYRVAAKFVPYDPPRKIAIVNRIDEVSARDRARLRRVQAARPDLSPRRGGRGRRIVHRLPRRHGRQDDLRPGRFLYVDRRPAPGTTFTLDLNRAYNPPCAFSDFTTCPLPPKQNILATTIEAGEKYPPHRRGLAAAG